MKEDKLDELLRRKLDGVEVEPPADMWTRVSAGLREVEGSAASVSDGVDKEPSEGVVMKIRRPNRRKMNWAYVAASVAACLMIAGVLYNYDEIDDAARKMVEAVENEGVVLPEYETVPDNVPDSRVAFTSRIAVSNPGIIAADYKEEEEYTEQESVPEDEHAPEGNSDDKRDGNIRQGRTGSSQPNVMPHTRAFNSAYAKRTARRSTPVSASVFAVNSGGLSGSSDKTGMTRLRSGSSLLLNEVDAATGSANPLPAEKLKHDYPLTFGLGVGIGITENLSVETGISYTYMKSEAELGGYGYAVKQKLHYLGIPVKVKYDFYKNRRLDLYASAGGAVEKLVSGNRTWTTKSKSGDSNLKPEKEKLKVSNIQASLGANIGVEIKIDRMFGIYVEPGVSYYFENNKQPDSYRTEHPLNFTLKAGFRVNL